MGAFYYDNSLEAFEAHFQWDLALSYLEKLYFRNKDKRVLYSLIGFSWFYLIEGPCVSKMYENDPSYLALDFWKRYINMGENNACEDPFFNFIAGYTLSLHGYLVDDEYKKTGNQMMKKCLILSHDALLRRLAENFLLNEDSKKYVPVESGTAICKRFFDGRSLLDGYFNEIYSSKPVTNIRDK